MAFSLLSPIVLVAFRCAVEGTMRLLRTFEHVLRPTMHRPAKLSRQLTYEAHLHLIRHIFPGICRRLAVHGPGMAFSQGSRSLAIWRLSRWTVPTSAPDRSSFRRNGPGLGPGGCVSA